MLKQFLDSLCAVRRGLPLPQYRSTTELIVLPPSYHASTAPLIDRFKTEDDSIEDVDDDTDGEFWDRLFLFFAHNVCHSYATIAHELLTTISYRIS
jgi:hypothetical protein